MARTFFNIPTQPYVGVLYKKPVALCDPTRKISNMVPVDIDWNVYGASSNKPNIGITLNMVAQNNVPSLLAAIMSVYIDNTNSNVPIFVYFPDTQFTAVCGPNTSQFIPVITGATSAIIFALGMATGSIPYTKIFFFDTIVQGFADVEKQYTFPQWRASPAIQRGSTFFTEGYGSPALGDQTQSAYIPITNLNPITLFGGAQSSGRIYLTHCFVYMSNLTTGATTFTLNYRIETVTSQLFLWTVQTIANTSIVYANLFSASAMQLVLDATLLWQFTSNLQVAGQRGGTTCVVNWTYQP